MMVPDDDLQQSPHPSEVEDSLTITSSSSSPSSPNPFSPSTSTTTSSAPGSPLGPLHQGVEDLNQNGGLKTKKIWCVKRAGPFRLGPQLATSPVKCVTNCLARMDGADDFFSVKIQTLPESPDKRTSDDIQGNILLQTEYNLLKLLQGQKGVLKLHGIYKDIAEEEVEIGGKGYLTGRHRARLLLVLQCYMPHDYSPLFANMINLQQFVIKEKTLPESLGIKIFYNIVEVVSRLHEQNVVHRDLKLGNVIMDKDSLEVTLTNFGLGRHLKRENEELIDQRGSPAYISPEVISGKPYLGKPSDMWALGVLLYTMLYGQFPFYDSSPTELFRKIKLAEYNIPTEYNVSQPLVKLIQSLLVLDPKKRLTADQTLERVRGIIEENEMFMVEDDLQVVPDFCSDDDESYQPRSKLLRGPTSFPDSNENGTDIEALLAQLSNSSNDASPEEEKGVGDDEGEEEEEATKKRKLEIKRLIRKRKAHSFTNIPSSRRRIRLV